MAASLLALGACGQSHTAAEGPEEHPFEGGIPPGADSGAQAGLLDGSTTEDDVAVRPLPPDAGRDAAVGDASEVISKLAPDVVPSSALARSILYSWTSELQVAELRANPVLLTRSESVSRGRTQLSTVLRALAADGNSLATLLTGPDFQKGRYAWSNAWATRRGWPDESYGAQLLRIVLKPEAWIVVATGRSLSAIDALNRPVDPAMLRAHPERIGAVYFVNEGPLGAYACGSFADCPAGAYREYFINNERMVQEWSLGTQTIRDEIERSIAQVQRLREWLSAYPYPQRDDCSAATAAVCAWLAAWPPPSPTAPSDLQLLQQYQLSLALTSEYYHPSVANMDALLKELSASLFVPDPLVHLP